jgi:SAM-dependent methyltransferase
VSSPIDKAISWYNQHAAEAAARYEAVSANVVHAGLLPLVEGRAGIALDVGAGSGRDAGWLASHGWDVVAVEPAGRLQELARDRHPSPRICWVEDELPGLARTIRLGLGFDLILLSAVWMHIPESGRRRAFRKLVTLLKAGGAIAISLRRGPLDPERGMHPVSVTEIERLAQDHGGFVEAQAENPDLAGRPGIAWTDLLVRLPDDGTRALPLLRHVILNDPKSSTYKLGLLRVLCRIGDGAAGIETGQRASWRRWRSRRPASSSPRGHDRCRPSRAVALMPEFPADTKPRWPPA